MPAFTTAEAHSKRNDEIDFPHPIAYDHDTPRRYPLKKPKARNEIDDTALRIVAVGDSITEGYDSSDEATKAWPAQLQAMLGDNTSAYEVTFPTPPTDHPTAYSATYGIPTTINRCSLLYLSLT